MEIKYENRAVILLFDFLFFKLPALLLRQKAALRLVNAIGQILIETRDFQTGFQVLLGNSFSPKQAQEDQSDRPQDGETDQNDKYQKN